MVDLIARFMYKSQCTVCPTDIGPILFLRGPKDGKTPCGNWTNISGTQGMHCKPFSRKAHSFQSCSFLSCTLAVLLTIKGWVHLLDVIYLLTSCTFDYYQFPTAEKDVQIVFDSCKFCSKVTCTTTSCTLQLLSRSKDVVQL